MTSPGGSSADLRIRLRDLADPTRARTLQRYFRTGAGEYGEGDRFLGIRVPALRRIARDYRTLPHAEVTELLRSPWHEERFVALLILVEQYRRGEAAERELIFRSYLSSTRFINNWDLVDASAEHIVGPHAGPGRISVLTGLASSACVWERRIAVMATFHWIRRHEFRPTLAVAELLLADQHDLIHKAVGWMLREIGKRSMEVEERFLHRHHGKMPRTMLRYAIERFPEHLRQQYLAGRPGATRDGT